MRAATTSKPAKLPWRDRLVGDVPRAMWATIIATALSLPFATANRVMGPGSSLHQAVTTYLMVFVTMFTAYPILTWLALRGRTREGLVPVRALTADFVYRRVTVHSILSFLFSTVVVARLVSAMLGIA